MSESKNIQERLIEFIAPMRIYIQDDGGDVTFKSFDEATGILYLETAGHCLGCASYDSTYTIGMRHCILENFKGEVKEVVFEPKKTI